LGSLSRDARKAVTRDCVTVATGKSKSYGKNRDSESQIQRLADPRCGRTFVSCRHASRKLCAMAHTKILHAVHCVTPIVRRDNFLCRYSSLRMHFNCATKHFVFQM
jgi:hypothetical protein